MKPRQYGDDPNGSMLLGVGSAHAVSENNSAGDIAGVLWVPDPEQRKGWREKYITAEQKPDGKRPLGFGKP